MDRCCICNKVRFDRHLDTHEINLDVDSFLLVNYCCDSSKCKKGLKKLEIELLIEIGDDLDQGDCEGCPFYLEGLCMFNPKIHDVELSLCKEF